MQQFVFSTSYTLHYDTKKPVPIGQIIEALVGIEKVLKSLSNVTKELTDLKDFEIRIEVEEIHSGSLWKTFVVSYLFETQEKLDEFIARVRKIVPPTVLVPVLIAGLLGYGGYLLTKPPAATNITLSDITDSVINVNGTQMPDSIVKALKNGVKNKKELATGTIMTLVPAKSQAGSSLKIITAPTSSDTTDTAEFEFTPAAIAKTPDNLKNIPTETTAELNNVIISIRATDLDSKEKGWAGKIEGVTGRVKIELAPEINTNDLASKRSFNADVTLTSKVGKDDATPKASSIYIKKNQPVTRPPLRRTFLCQSAGD